MMKVGPRDYQKAYEELVEMTSARISQARKPERYALDEVVKDLNKAVVYLTWLRDYVIIRGEEKE